MSPSQTGICNQIQANLDAVQEQIKTASETIGFEHPVELVAVTKYSQIEIVECLVELGHQHFGENRPQQLIERAEILGKGNWHLIGQLQSNKVRAVLPYVAMIHSVDSRKLLERIVRIGSDLNCFPPVLLQVNVSGEATKSGFSVQQIEEQWEYLYEIAGQQIQGLMTMAPLTNDDSVIRKAFGGLRELRDTLEQRSPEISLPHLSMGMSGDFELAIQEGATLVRVGSLLLKGI